MTTNYSNLPSFEAPLAELEAQIEQMRQNNASVELDEHYQELEKSRSSLVKSIFSRLSAWDTVQLARHPRRPHTLDYIQRLIKDFEELHGDRCFADDRAIIAGIGIFEGQPVAVCGHEKGRAVHERVLHNFGMARPEGYRKTQRLMRLAERFKLPLITLIDTPGAHPGTEAEERGQSVAIAENLETMAKLRVPIVSAVIGEGGSGGAIAIGVADRVLMMRYSIYSVISPEGCASILWRDPAKAPDAAQAMKITAADLEKFGFIDAVVPEPEGGAHKNFDEAASSLKKAIIEAFDQIEQERQAAGDKGAFSTQRRYERLLRQSTAARA